MKNPFRSFWARPTVWPQPPTILRAETQEEIALALEQGFERITTTELNNIVRNYNWKTRADRHQRLSTSAYTSSLHPDFERNRVSYQLSLNTPGHPAHITLANGMNSNGLLEYSALEIELDEEGPRIIHFAHNHDENEIIIPWRLLPLVVLHLAGAETDDDSVSKLRAVLGGNVRKHS